MRCITKPSILQLVQLRLHALVVLSILVLAVLGSIPESQAGRLTCPPQVVVVRGGQRYGRRRCPRCDGVHPGAGRWYLSHTWHIPLLRSLLPGGLWHLSGREGPAWVSLIPWVQWLWQGGGLRWPWLLHQPEWQAVRRLLGQGQLLAMAALAGLSLEVLLRGEGVTFPPRLRWERGARAPASG